MSIIKHVSFPEALRSGDKEIIRTFPKTDVYNHAVFGMRCSFSMPVFSALMNWKQYERFLPQMNTGFHRS